VNPRTLSGVWYTCGFRRERKTAIGVCEQRESRSAWGSACTVDYVRIWEGEDPPRISYFICLGGSSWPARTAFSLLKAVVLVLCTKAHI